MVLADGLQTLEQPFRGGQIRLEELLERVDENQTQIEVLGHDAAQETHEHLVAGQFVFAGIDETNLMPEVVHITRVVVDEDDIVLGISAGHISHVNNALGFTRAFLSGNHLNQG